MSASNEGPAEEFRFAVPFLDHLGAQLVACADGEARSEMELDRHHLNTFGAAHGGVLMTLLDYTMAMAATARGHHTDTERMSVVTIEMKTSFLEPARDHRIVTRARCVHRTRSLAFCEAETADGSGRILARASGTFRCVPLSKVTR